MICVTRSPEGLFYSVTMFVSVDDLRIRLVCYENVKKLYEGCFVLFTKYAFLGALSKNAILRYGSQGTGRLGLRFDYKRCVRNYSFGVVSGKRGEKREKRREYTTVFSDPMTQLSNLLIPNQPITQLPN